MEQHAAFLDSLPFDPFSVWLAAHRNQPEGLWGILRAHPNVDINWKGSSQSTPFYQACERGHDAVLFILLAHPAIDVNQTGFRGISPFGKACSRGHTSCVRLLLKDSRVNVTEPNEDEYTPLWPAACNGYLDVIKWWIASGREMDLEKSEDVDKTDAIGIAKKNVEREIVTLLESFMENAEETRHQVRVEIDWYDEAAAEMFALVVFQCDGLLQIKETALTPAARFFNIARSLPLELQMVACYRAVGSARVPIPNRSTEDAFKGLGTKLFLESSLISWLS